MRLSGFWYTKLPMAPSSAWPRVGVRVRATVRARVRVRVRVRVGWRRPLCLVQHLDDLLVHPRPWWVDFPERLVYGGEALEHHLVRGRGRGRGVGLGG